MTKKRLVSQIRPLRINLYISKKKTKLTNIEKLTSRKESTLKERKLWQM